MQHNPFCFPPFDLLVMSSYCRVCARPHSAQPPVPFSLSRLGTLFSSSDDQLPNFGNFGGESTRHVAASVGSRQHNTGSNNVQSTDVLVEGPSPSPAAARQSSSDHRTGLEGIELTSAPQHVVIDNMGALVRYVDTLRRGFFSLCDAVKEDLANVRLELRSTILDDVRGHVEAIVKLEVQKNQFQLMRDRQDRSGGGGSAVAEASDVRYRTDDLEDKLARLGTDFEKLTAQMKLVRSTVDELRTTTTTTSYEFASSTAARGVSAQRQLSLGADGGGVGIGRVDMERLVIDMEQRVMDNVRRLLKASDATSTEKVSAQIAPSMDHVHKLTAAHRQMMDSLIDDRCARLETRLEAVVLRFDQQLADTRSRLSSLRSDVRGALGAMSSTLNIAAPAL